MHEITHSQFQSLSACEALSIQRAVSEAILTAYETGINLMLQAHLRLDELPLVIEENLTGFGYTPEAAKVLALRIRLNVTK